MKNLVRMFVVLSIVAFATACSPKQECKEAATCDSTQVDTLVSPVVDSATTVK